MACSLAVLGIFTLQRGLLAAQAFTQQVVGAVDSGVDAVRYRGEPPAAGQSCQWSFAAGEVMKNWRVKTGAPDQPVRVLATTNEQSFELGRAKAAPCPLQREAARNSLAPQFARFDDNVATHKAAELGKKAPLTTGEQSPEAN